MYTFKFLIGTENVPINKNLKSHLKQVSLLLISYSRLACFKLEKNLLMEQYKKTYLVQFRELSWIYKYIFSRLYLYLVYS